VSSTTAVSSGREAEASGAVAATPNNRARYRRVQHLVFVWRGAERRVCNCRSGAEVIVEPPLLRFLDLLDAPQTVRSLTAALGDVPAPLVRQAVLALHGAGLVERVGSDPDDGFAEWAPWSPHATLFHFGTKNVRYRTERAVMRTRDTSHAPPPVKRYPGAPLIRLADAHDAGALPQTLLARRTWRRFGREPIAFQDVSTLLGLTWGVQHWMGNPGHPPMALKTSPSGGARHSIEAYVIALRTTGLRRGIYHFNPDRHALTCVARGATPALVRRLLPMQRWYSDAGAIFVMTSIFDRVRARYRHPRAYRGILLEAGHLCQTFCLVATWLGLAPFCTNAFADTAIERLLGVDGVRESAVYVAGVGSRPPHATWAPQVGKRPLPTLLPAAHRGRAR